MRAGEGLLRVATALSRLIVFASLRRFATLTRKQAGEGKENALRKPLFGRGRIL